MRYRDLLLSTSAFKFNMRRYMEGEWYALVDEYIGAGIDPRANHDIEVG